MPSFDIVSELDKHELTNAIDNAQRKIDNRFDFKGTPAKITQEGNPLCSMLKMTFSFSKLTAFSMKVLQKEGLMFGH